MEDEAGRAPGAYRNSMISKVRTYKRDFEKLKKDLVSNDYDWNFSGQILTNTNLHNVYCCNYCCDDIVSDFMFINVMHQPRLSSLEVAED